MLEGARENRGMRLGRKCREAEVLRGREAGEQKKKVDPNILCYLHLVSSEQTSKRKFALGGPLAIGVKQTEHRVIVSEIVNPFSAGYVIRHADMHY